MPQKNCKRIILEIPHWIYEEIKLQAKEHNIPMRALILKFLLPELIKRRNIRLEDE